ncbi:MAG: hypothetical protein JXA96_14370 [Sedimentisphaerales bacterium]|nr:hypothetical protein [Sedimentisphaerales bacterium]
MRLKSTSRDGLLITDTYLDDLIQNALILSNTATCENKVWNIHYEGVGKQQILIKDIINGETQILDNNILDGKPVSRFVNTPYGFLGIGKGSVGLIETENMKK